MKKTFTKRFFPSLLLMLVGCLWGNSAWAEEETINFANGALTDNVIVWQGTSCSITQAKGTSTSSPSYIEAPRWYANHVITFAAKEGYTLTGVTVVATSTSYANVFKNSTFSSGASASVSGTTVTITTSGDFSITMSAKAYISSVTVSYVSSSAPTLKTTTDGPLSFGNVETGTSKQLTFTLSGENLTADATLSITGDAYFSVNPATASQTDGTIADTEVTVTYAPTATGPHTATLTIASGETTKEIALSGTGIAPLAHYTVNWMVNGTAYTEGTPTTDVAEGNKVTALPTTPPAIGDKVFVGWTNAAIPTEQATAPSVLFATAEDAPTVTGNVTYYAVYATQSGSAPVETLAQTLAYDTWTYSGSTTDKSSYRLFHTGSYVESESFDLSTLSKVVVYGGTFGGGSYNKLNIGDGTNTWKDVTVSGSSQTGVNTYTDGTPLSGTGKLRVTSQCGSASGNGVRISKVEIYTLQGGYTYSAYATTVEGKILEERNLSFGETTVFDVYNTTFSAPELKGATNGVTYTSSNEAVATVDANTGTVTITGTTFGTTTIKAAADKDENYLADEATYTLSVWPTSIAGIKQLINSTTATDFKAELTNATITYVNGNNVYLQDDNAAILMYLPGHALTAGKSYTGRVTGTGMLYSGLREITAIDLSGITPTDNTKKPETVSLAQLNDNFDAYESKYVKVVGVTTGTFTIGSSYQTTTITQGTDELQLRAPNALTLIANNDYDFVGFPGVYNSTRQLNIWEESQAINQGKLSADLAFGQAVYNMEVDGSVTVNATNASGAAIVYSVADETHCLVDSKTGYFTADAVGTYTVTATCEATGSYAAGTATCQVVVTAPVSNLKPTVLYKKITSTVELVDGGVYLIVCENKKDAMGTLDTSNKRVSSSNTITIKDDKGFSYYDGEVNATGLPYEITITKDKDVYNLYHAEGKYINGTSGTNLTFNDVTDAGWSISFVGSTGNVQISYTGNTNYIQRNSTASNKFYKNYGSGGDAVQLYQKVSEMNVHAKVNGYTTFVADFAYVMPTALTGKTVSVAANGTMSIDDAFQGGEEVPALTPLLVRTSEAYAADETVKTYYPVITTKTVSVTEEVKDLIAANNLEYYRTAEGMTSLKKLSSPCYYKLSVDNEGNNPGFYWGATDGAAFAMKNGSTAYLACAPLSKVSKFVIDENGTTTAIEGVTAEDGTNGESVVYNLQGIRVNPKNLQKGIYIINGRKTVVK